MGMLHAGEVLIDDLRVVEDPDGAAVQLVAGGDFEGGAGGWRFIGNHRHSEVIDDPDNPGNRVLRLSASGPTEHMHNHAEITLAGGRAVQNGRRYEISFRAKWIGGARLLNTRLYFNRVPKTFVLDVPMTNGTPGTVNSTRETNIGPTYSALRHEPAVPAAGRAGDGIRPRGGSGRRGGRRGLAQRQRRRLAADLHDALRGRRVLRLDLRPGGRSHRPLLRRGDRRTRRDVDLSRARPRRARPVQGRRRPGHRHAEQFSHRHDRRRCEFHGHGHSPDEQRAAGLHGRFRRTGRLLRCRCALERQRTGPRDRRAHRIRCRFHDADPFLGVHATVAIDRSGLGSAKCSSTRS